MWALALSYGVAAYTSYVFFTWFYLYLVNVRGMTKTAGGYWAGLPYVAVAVGTIAGGRLSDWLTLRYGKRFGRLALSWPEKDWRRCSLRSVDGSTT